LLKYFCIVNNSLTKQNNKNKKTMKKNLFNLFYLITIAALTITFVSCDKDNDDDDLTQIDPADFKGELAAGIHTLDATQTYKLTGQVVVLDGAELVIPAGTLIEGVGGTSAAIIVRQGGKIFVNGTKEAPVVMTSGLANKKAGDWGGLVICGRATCNSGGGISEVGDSPYGGDIDDDNSGIVRYLRIEYSGAAFNSEKEYNGLSLFGVGSGTVIEYVQIHENADDGIEFYGGTVSANYIVVSNVEDDMFDWTEGWSGSGSYWFGLNDKGYGNRGMECDNWSTNHSATPVANPTISNVTLIGSGDQGNEPQGMELRAGTQGTINNVVLKNWKQGIRVSGDVSNGYMGTDLTVTNVKFIDCAVKVTARNDAGDTIEIPEGFYTENDDATGAGAGENVPEWAQGWTIGLE
jgi:hypothetical protein